MRLPLRPFLRRSARAAPNQSLNPSRSSADASTGRRGAWFSMGARGTRETLWTTPRTQSADIEQQLSRVDERASRRSSRGLRWIALLIVIASAFVAVMLATSSG